jgi:2-C-methyl-D-erythritol 4-phosphate cytidylyltransferase
VRAGAIVVAAGSGDRLGSDLPKALVRAAGLPLVTWSVRALVAAPSVGPVVVVAPPGAEREVAAALGAGTPVHAIVPGGASRQRSVAHGLSAMPHDVQAIAVHDAARPLLSPELVEDLVAGLAMGDAVIAAAPVADTLKRVNTGGFVGETVNRAGLWGAQTPQVFRSPVFRQMFSEADDAELDSATDCAGMAERRGVRVAVLDPGMPNPKVTTPSDLRLVEALLGAQRIA